MRIFSRDIPSQRLMEEGELPTSTSQNRCPAANRIMDVSRVAIGTLLIFAQGLVVCQAGSMLLFGTDDENHSTDSRLSLANSGNMLVISSILWAQSMQQRNHPQMTNGILIGATVTALTAFGLVASCFQNKKSAFFRLIGRHHNNIRSFGGLKMSLLYSKF